MTLTEMRRALETTPSTDEQEEAELSTEDLISRLPPENRGVNQSRSCLVEVDLPAGGNASRKGTLTFSNSISEFKRAGSSRRPGPRRAPPRRAQSCLNG